MPARCHRFVTTALAASLLIAGVAGTFGAGSAQADGTVENVPGSTAAPLTLPPAGAPATTTPANAAGAAPTSYPAAVTGPAPAAATDFAAGQAAVAKKNWTAAVTSFTKAAGLDPTNADIENLWAFSLRNSGDYQGALTHYAKALKLNPAHRGAHEYLGETYLALKQPAKAKAELATLKKLCGVKCEQYVDLSRGLAAYEKAAKKK